MSFAQDEGYTPKSVLEIIEELRVEINTAFETAYSEEEFEGTNFYKFAYVLAQRVALGEIKASEIFQKLQQYIALTNAKIQRPTVSAPGIVDSFDSQGYLVSVKPMEVADRGKANICVDVDDEAEDYEDTKAEILSLLSQYIVGGVVCEGSETGDVVLSNGQSMPYAYHLPTDVPIVLRLTVSVSENTTLTPPDDITIRQQIFDQIAERYRLGLNFEPQRYYNLSDADWAESVILEYSLDAGENWTAVVYDSEFDEKITFGLEDISVVGL